VGRCRQAASSCAASAATATTRPIVRRSRSSDGTISRTCSGKSLDLFDVQSVGSRARWKAGARTNWGRMPRPGELMITSRRRPEITDSEVQVGYERFDCSGKQRARIPIVSGIMAGTLSIYLRRRGGLCPGSVHGAHAIRRRGMQGRGAVLYFHAVQDFKWTSQPRPSCGAIPQRGA